VTNLPRSSYLITGNVQCLKNDIRCNTIASSSSARFKRSYR
uniref:Uncharacterized protein n=1 Tax=Schistosoma curassoni TaxID=6186 RepID=A0A183KH35_9TREM